MSAVLAQRMRAATVDAGMTYSDRHEPSFWLRGRLADLFTAARLGAVRPCQHLRAGMIGSAVLWAPDQVVCGPCTAGFALTGDADRTCDRCGVVTSGKGIHSCIVAASSNLVVSYGLCGPCYRREVGR